jgi:hypothetical protein
MNLESELFGHIRITGTGCRMQDAGCRMQTTQFLAES